MLTVTGNAAVDADTTLVAVQNSTTTDGTTDVSGATVFGGVQRNTKLNPGEYINLLYNANGITTDDTSYGTIDGLDTVTSAGFINYKAIVEKKDANTIVITIPKDEKELLIRIRRSFRKTGKMQPIRSRTQATSSPAAPSMLQKAHGLKTMISKRSSYRMLSSADTISTITPAPTSTATAWPPTSAS